MFGLFLILSHSSWLNLKMFRKNWCVWMANLLLAVNCQDQPIHLTHRGDTSKAQSHPWVPKPLKLKSSSSANSLADYVRADLFDPIVGLAAKTNILPTSHNAKQRPKRTLPFWDCALTLCAFQYSRIVSYRNTVFLGPLYDLYRGNDVEKIQKSIKKHRESVDKASESVKMFKKKTDMRKKLFALLLENSF
ncbi:uncharacterized protein LOC131878947 [Tigriopus californicus]|uniref:uncharacterized protein LOC131878947 n=1 Tax=Tigriopus californicus TaxID=6832 RepID=UPI0027DA6D69|nr:uncharacterized protein LOC131878947 [Tigriopus californicus]